MDQSPTMGGFVELVPVGGYGPASYAPQHGLSRASQIARYGRYGLFLLLFVLPSALAILYYGVFALDRYVSEARFVVRTPQRSNAGPLSSVVPSAAGVEQRSADEAHLVNAFLASRDAAFLLVEKHGFRDVLADGRSDPLMRFPGFFEEGKDEELFKRYEDLVQVKLDSTSGISTLTVQAYRPEDAQRLSLALLDAAEALVNRLNERSSGDAIRTAERTVELARRRSNEALDELTEFRTRETMTDPTRLSAGVFAVIGRLTLERAQTRAQLAELQSGLPGSVQANSVRNRLLALDDEILRERRNLAGSDASLAPKIAAYERFVLNREFADRALTSALQSLDSARLDALNRRLYLGRVVEPRAPDQARYPYRWWWTAFVIALSAMTYLIVRVLATNLLQHGRE